jgi:hypothetical protein
VSEFFFFKVKKFSSGIWGCHISRVPIGVPDLDTAETKVVKRVRAMDRRWRGIERFVTSDTAEEDEG